MMIYDVRSLSRNTCHLPVVDSSSLAAQIPRSSSTWTETPKSGKPKTPKKQRFKRWTKKLPKKQKMFGIWSKKKCDCECQEFPWCTKWAQPDTCHNRCKCWRPTSLCQMPMRIVPKSGAKIQSESARSSVKWVSSGIIFSSATVPRWFGDTFLAQSMTPMIQTAQMQLMHHAKTNLSKILGGKKS